MNKLEQVVARFGAVRQLGHVVANVDEGIATLSAQGIGPWTVMRNVRLHCMHEGEPSAPILNVALAYQDETQIELIQQLNDAPSPYRAMIESGDFGLHHHAWLCDDINGDIERAQQQGLVLACDIHAMDGARYAYFRPLEPGGLYIELLQSTRLMRAMFRHGPKLARRWQGGAGPIEIDLANPARILRSLLAAMPAWWQQRFRG